MAVKIKIDNVTITLTEEWARQLENEYCTKDSIANGVYYDVFPNYTTTTNDICEPYE